MVANEHKLKKGADLGDVKCVRSIAKVIVFSMFFAIRVSEHSQSQDEKESFARPVLAGLSEALDSVQMVLSFLLFVISFPNHCR